jgi:hypothetical protein
MNQVKGVLFLPENSFINSQGGPGSDPADGRFIPKIDNSNSPAAAAVPNNVDATGATGPGPLLPFFDIGDNGNGVHHTQGALR